MDKSIENLPPIQPELFSSLVVAEVVMLPAAEVVMVPAAEVVMVPAAEVVMVPAAEVVIVPAAAKAVEVIAIVSSDAQRIDWRRLMINSPKD